jgi:hypothetical protein
VSDIDRASRWGGLVACVAVFPAAMVSAAMLLSAAPRDAGAQPPGARPAARFQPEARADFIDARAEAAHFGAGVAVAAGTYARLAIIGGAGRAWTDDGSRAAGRVDALVRFVVDPLGEFRWAPYAFGGVGALYDTAERWRGVIVGGLGVEGPIAGGVVPAVEVGFGGGARVGLVMRRAMPGRR